MVEDRESGKGEDDGIAYGDSGKNLAANVLIGGFCCGWVRRGEMA